MVLQLAALKGAGKVLPSVEVILIEAPLMNYNEGTWGRPSIDK